MSGALSPEPDPREEPEEPSPPEGGEDEGDLDPRERALVAGPVPPGPRGERDLDRHPAFVAAEVPARERAVGARSVAPVTRVTRALASLTIVDRR